MSATWTVEARVTVTFEREDVDDDADISAGDASKLERAVLTALSDGDLDSVDEWVAIDWDVNV